MVKNKINCEGVVIELPIKLYSVLSMEYVQKYSEHAEIYVRGILGIEEKIRNVYSLGMNDVIMLKEKEVILFSGIVTHVSVKKEGDLTLVTIKGKSRSILLDMKKKTRSFQKAETYLDLLKKIMGTSGIIYMPKEMQTKKKEQFVMQYKETDWEFIKRMASHMHVPICPNIEIEKSGIYIGYRDGKEIDDKIVTYTIQKDISEYMKYREQDSSANHYLFTTLKIKSNKKFSLGDKIKYKEVVYSIIKIHMEYKDGLLFYTYSLRNAKGIKCRKKYHSALVGSTVNGKIIKVSSDRVKLHLDMDESQSTEEALWFQVAIGYTAEGSTGLYTAMDEGERVKLFFPSADEADAYVRCVDKKDSESSQHFSDPVTKSYGTPYGSCMQATKDGFLISSVKDEIFIKMGEADGITLESAENINIYTEKGMEWKGRKLNVQSKDKIIFNTEGSNIIVDETIHIKTKG